MIYYPNFIHGITLDITLVAMYLLTRKGNDEF